MKIGASTLAGVEFELGKTLDFIENLGIEYPLKDLPPLTKEEALKAKLDVFKGYKHEKKLITQTGNEINE